MKLPWLRTLSGQVIALFVILLVAVQGLNLFFLLGERRISARAQQIDMQIENYLDAASALPDLEMTELPHLVRQGAPSLGAVFLSVHNRSQIGADGVRYPEREAQILAALNNKGLHPEKVFLLRRPIQPPGRDAAGRPDWPAGMFHPGRPPDQNGPPGPGMEEIVISAEIAPDIWLNAMAAHYAAETVTLHALLTTLAALAVAIGAAILIARHVSGPVRQLAIAAEDFGRGESPGAVAERGPEDVRRAARAFNDMQARLAHLIETQRTMLRAVGHDLRTPLTSLRLHAEDLPASETRDRMIATIDDMGVMTGEILSWAKDTSAMEDPAAVHLTALLESIVDDYIDHGRDVALHTPPENLVVTIRRVALRRVLTNLIDNALKYGERAHLSLSVESGRFTIQIDDDGPGIPEDQLEDVLRPFVRLETSRNKATGGVGLGLSISQSILAAQGGQLVLVNRPKGGLSARVTLPH